MPLLAGALLLFVLGLQMLLGGASAAIPVLQGLRLEGFFNALGVGWIMAYAVLSGSPVAAVSLALFGAHRITALESLGMVAGSRFGAAFVVLLVAILYVMRRRRGAGTLAIGILCLLVTWSIYVPATAMACLALSSGVLDGARVVPPAALARLMSGVFDPLLAWMEGMVGPAPLFLLGLVTMVASFHLFDRALPDIDSGQTRFEQIAYVVYKPQVMFLLGIAVTFMTLSVSVSLGLLVPLSGRGYVRRENIVPYIMGANVSTFVDTLLVSILVGEPQALSIVLAEMLSVLLVSLVILVGFYSVYRDAIDWCLERALQGGRATLVFAGILLFVPVVLLMV